MADTQRLETPDHFGPNWASRSPTRVQGARSPGPQYISEQARLQIRPGANNSFNTNESPIRGIRQTNNFIGQAAGTSRPLRGSSQDRNIISPLEHARAQRDFSTYTGDDRIRRRRAASQERSEHREMLPSESSGIPQDSSEHPGDDRTRRRRAPSQRAMLSQALQQANHAVVLDNAQNFEGATRAYHDACDLLQQVILRSSGGEDRKKLETIRNTYRNRIRELQTNELAMTAPLDKALPDVPVGPYTIQREQFVHPSEDDEELVLESVTILHTERTNDQNLVTYPSSNTLNEISDRPPLFPSPLPSIIAVEESMSALPQEEVPIEWRHELEAEIPSSVTTLKTDIDEDCVPPPLSPRPPASPQPQEPELQDLPSSVQSRSTTSGHQRLATMESTSWLDTIDESAGSSSSSAHSRTSSIGLRGKHMRNISGNTEAEFDAALDAAVEAAYDDGYELMDGEEETPEPTIVHDSAYSNEVRKNVDLAKQRVRDMERETAILAARENERKRIEDGKEIQQTFDDAEGEEEERMLEDMTRNYILEHRDINTAPKAIPPRQSDSSEFSGRTLGSSVGSTLTAGTSLSTVSELTSLPILSTQAQTKAPVAPPPTGALPAPPITKTQGILPSSRFVPDISPRTSTAVSSAPGVRERRLSGQKASVLTINTAVRLPTSLAAPKTHAAFELPPLAPPNQLPDAPRSATLAMELIEDPENMISPPTESLPDSSKQISGPSPASTSRLIDHEEHTFASTSPARTRPTLMGLRKNFSASSLRSLTRHGAVTPVSEDIPGTPMTRIFSSGSVSQRPEIMPDLPTPGVASFAKAGANAVGLSILDNDIHSPRTPGLPNANAMNPPIPLEPCPESFLLRPFWLMRALYQTIAHPRGGYISTRLFVPRDTWRVVNVKLKNVDEKVANCDMLTAALMNLSKVDTLDADAVLEELQSFELILDQVQAQLNKKLGADVGVQGSAALFRSPPIGADDNSNTDNNTRASGIGSKPYLSWKRLRSKNSVGPGLPLATGATSKSDSKDFLTMRSLPMTSVSNPRFAKRDPTKVLGIGPHSHYMASLGRLCDAVQVLDQIARQVEDPGLRLSSQTHVGLELCIRHAAEFFAFFICRFALSDLGMMLDKFIKRGSEWVLA